MEEVFVCFCPVSKGRWTRDGNGFHHVPAKRLNFTRTKPLSVDVEEVLVGRDSIYGTSDSFQYFTPEGKRPFFIKLRQSSLLWLSSIWFQGVLERFMNRNTENLVAADLYERGEKLVQVDDLAHQNKYKKCSTAQLIVCFYNVIEASIGKIPESSLRKIGRRGSLRKRRKSKYSVR